MNRLLDANEAWRGTRTMPVDLVLSFGDACPSWSLASEGRPG